MTRGDGKSSLRSIDKSFCYRSKKLKPVRMHMTIKKRKGDLLELLELNRVKFSDNEHDATNAIDDRKSPYFEIKKIVKKQKASTKRNYYDDEVQAIMPEFTKALDGFITKSFAKWK